MKLTAFLTVMFLIIFGAKLTSDFFAPTVPLLEIFQTPLWWLSIVTGVLAGLSILIRLIKEITELFSTDRDKKE